MPPGKLGVGHIVAVVAERGHATSRGGLRPAGGDTMIAAPWSPGGTLEFVATAVSVAIQGVIGGYALLATLVAGSCLVAGLGALVRDVSGELTFGTRPSPRD